MKTISIEQKTGSVTRANRVRGMTLVEAMVSMGIFSLVAIGLLYSNLFGLRQDELVNSKLGASDESRRAFNRLTREIRSAKKWQVGLGTQTDFTPIANGQSQQGNALQLSFTTDTNNYTRYYFNSNTSKLYRMQNGGSGFQVIARYLTNNMFFRAEDYLGNIKTDLSYKYVIRVMMEFYQYQYPITKVGGGYYYDYYKLEFKVTPHCPDGA